GMLFLPELPATAGQLTRSNRTHLPFLQGRRASAGYKSSKSPDIHRTPQGLTLPEGAGIMPLINLSRGLHAPIQLQRQ
ncbi:MAG TPA: hypothetical protein PLS77_11220, partial [Anaerolineaceae bacterium]|nr:hypothetical protein [Anaerolineaceae bacterium]